MAEGRVHPIVRRCPSPRTKPEPEPGPEHKSEPEPEARSPSSEPEPEPEPGESGAGKTEAAKYCLRYIVARCGVAARDAGGTSGRSDFVEQCLMQARLRPCPFSYPLPLPLPRALALGIHSGA